MAALLTEVTTTVTPAEVAGIADLLVFWHQDCVEHEILHHPEQPGRVSSILALLRENFSEEVFQEAPMVTDEQILLFHSSQHLSMIKRLCDKAEKGPPHELFNIDGDTTVMSKTRNAAYRAAGSMVAAVDAIFSTELNGTAPKARSAFCCVRPPGHHAERNKACGFCFFNNAAIGARFAQDRYGVKKVAVIDFDVHHGNGTEEGFAPDETLFYGSTHELDNFPGTGRDPSPYVGAKAKKPLHRRIVNRTLNAGPCSVKQFHTKWYVRLSLTPCPTPLFVQVRTVICCDLLLFYSYLRASLPIDCP
jgi:acetoin utilization deacetylase AcuC-like enzyme